MKASYSKYAILLLALLFTISPISASRPKVGLALGGGGAKGAATIGVLKVIEEAGVKVDYIAGTSIGAIIGGLYASGYTTSEIETLFLSQEYQDILQGHKVDSMLMSVFARRGIKYFRDTKIPFRCVAANADTFEEVVLSSGMLLKAIRASMSIPEIYEPVQWGDQYLVDGGLVNNLPVDVVKDMGADIIIAIDLQQKDEFSLGISMKDFLGIGGLADWFFARPDLKRRSQSLKEADVHIRPRLPDFTAASFGQDNCELMLKLGEEKAREHWEELEEIKNRQEYYKQKE